MENLNTQTAPAPQAPAAAPEKPATKALRQANGAKGKAPAKAKGKPAPAPAKRVSRIAPIQGSLLTLMQSAGAKGVSVAASAEKLKATEREVRLAIDRARAGGHKIDRISKGMFAFAKGYKFKPETAK